MTFISYYVVLVVIQMVSSQYDFNPQQRPVPDRCKNLTPHVLVRCCPLEPMFKIEDLKACGLDIDRRPSPLDTDCGPTMCLFNNQGALTNGTIIISKLISLIDQYTAPKTHIVKGMKLAKLKCIGKKKGPPQPRPPFGHVDHQTCELHKIFICLTTVVLWNCEFIPNTYCHQLEENMLMCKQFVF